MFTRLMPALAILAMSSSAWAESKLSFVDMRVEGGATTTTGPLASLTLMCGDIGDKDPHVVEMDQDVGIVIGVRGLVGRTTAPINGAPDQPVRLAGGEFLG